MDFIWFVSAVVALQGMMQARCQELPAIQMHSCSADEHSPKRRGTAGPMLLQHKFSEQRSVATNAGNLTIVFIPDTQNMVEDLNRNGWRLSDWIAQVDWIMEQKDALNIQAVIHVGDLVQIATRSHEWDNFNKGWEKIVQSGIAWSMVPGNHDLNTMACWDCEDRWDIYNQRMTSMWERNAYLESSYPPGRYENSVVLFEAAGIEFMIVAIELGPGVTRSSQGTLDWASAKLRQYPQRRAIINNHFVLWGTERSEVISITEWAKQHRNIFLVQQGHDCAREWNKVVYNDWDEPIMEVLADYQCSGDSYLRYYTFHLDAKEIQAYTYSPVLQKFERDGNSQFTFPFELGTPSGTSITQNIYRQVNGVGSWGGWCTCPDGKRYNVGDRDDACEKGPGSLACIGGVPGECEKVHDDSRDGMQVTCMTSTESSTTSAPTFTVTTSPATTSGATTNFELVDGGSGRACRGPGGKNDESFYDLEAAGSIDDCKASCAAVPGCTGVEWNPDGRCEVWTTAIESSVAVDGYTCMRAAASSSKLPVTTQTTSAEPKTTTSQESCYDDLGAVAVDEGVGIGDKIETLSTEECKKRCNDADQCQSFAFCAHYSGCWLKTKAFSGSEATRDFYDCTTFYKKSCHDTQAASSSQLPVTTRSPPATTSTRRCGRQIRWAPHPDKCLSASDDDTSSDSGTNIQLWDCTSSMRDTKFLMPDGGSGLIRWSPFPHLCLGVSGGSNRDGTNIQLETCDEAVPGQIFRVVSDSSPHAITWVNTDKCLDVQDGENTNGANLQIWWCLSSDWGNAGNQQFVVSSTDSCEEASATTTVLAATTSSFFSTTNSSGAACCAEFGQWPAVDGVTCGTCTALVSTNPYGGRCDRYCESFGHVCVGAAEEENENCRAKYYSRCDQAVQGTSDMLCSCRNVAAPESCPTLLPPQPGPSPQPSPSPTPSLVWSDEFDGDGPVDNSKWGFDIGGGGWGNNELQFYTDRTDNARQEGGVLKVVAKCEDYGGRSYTSARVVSRGKGDWGPGHRIVARAKVPTGRGSWPAIWMLPTDWEYGGWPDSGEIDIMEHVGCDTGDVVGTVHTEAFNHMINTQKGSTKTLDDVTAWHTYTIDWEDSIIHWYVDDVHFHSFTGNLQDPAEWPFNKRFHLLLNIAVGGDWGGYCLGRPPSCSSGEEFGAEQVMEIDYVRIYAIR